MGSKDITRGMGDSADVNIDRQINNELTEIEVNIQRSIKLSLSLTAKDKSDINDKLDSVKDGLGVVIGETQAEIRSIQKKLEKKIENLAGLQAMVATLMGEVKKESNPELIMSKVENLRRIIKQKL